jgi:hypothetical protein
MTDAEEWRAGFAGIEVLDSAFSEAVVTFQDGSSLRFRHRVGERWAKAEGHGLAQYYLTRLSFFRLNAKHLEIRLRDGTTWEARFRG